MSSNIIDLNKFAELLFEKMVQVNAGLAELALYEFCYALENITPELGWASVKPTDKEELKNQIGQNKFFEEIKLKPIKNGRIVLDERIVQLTQVLFVGLVTENYSVEWVKKLFYFDIRGFSFFVRTNYYNQKIFDHFGGKPYLLFEACQRRFETNQEIGYREFQEANRLIDQAFIETIAKLIDLNGIPLMLTLVGPSAAGKTEIVKKLCDTLAQAGKSVTTIEMDNFYKDREFRDGKSMNKEVIHFDLFKQSMIDLKAGKRISIPRYNFYKAISSHDLNSNLRPGNTLTEVEPADIVLLEGNFPFHIQEIASLIGIKVVYLTDDPIRLKRKWKRDIDYRKKYDPFYLCNRYFKTQLLRAQEVYLPMMEVCDVVVDTTAASLWVTPVIANNLGRH